MKRNQRELIFSIHKLFLNLGNLLPLQIDYLRIPYSKKLKKKLIELKNLGENKIYTSSSNQEITKEVIFNNKLQIKKIVHFKFLPTL